MTTRPNVVFVLGPPGSGKGTQCIKLAEKFKYLHLSAGELLREERRKEGSPFGAQIERHFREGTIVPVEITVSLLDRAMQNSPSRLVLIDGFPRNQNNLEGWEGYMKDRANVSFVLMMECPLEACLERCLTRGEGRIDDNEETLRKRVDTFNKQTSSVIKYYDAKGMVRRVDAAQTPAAVFEDVQKVLATAS